MTHEYVQEQVLGEEPTEPQEAPEVASEEQAPPEQVEAEEATEEPSEPVYEPNFKYNVQSKEFEFDERLRGIIKDKDSEDYVRDLVTKAHGLDTYKTKLSERDAAFNEMKDKYGEVETNAKKYELGFERLEQLKNSDLSSFAQAWGISDKQVLDLARSIVQQDENPTIAAQRQAQFQNVVQGWQSQDQQQMAQSQISQESARLHNMEMELAFSKPEVTDFQDAYDRVRGEQGAFRKLVDTYGSAHWNQGTQLSPRDCVKAVMEEFGAFVAPPKVEPQPVPQAQPQGTANPTLPNLGSGKTGSPVAKKVSWEEMKKMGGL